MKKLLISVSSLALLVSASLVIGQNTRFSDPNAVIKDQFWGNLYAEGGHSFFCDTPFTSKGFTLTDGYVYPLADIRSALNCGTSRQCEQDNRYRQIASDLHNMVPVRSRIEMQRRNIRYDDVGNVAQPDDCGIRASAQFFEPPKRVKGDVARTVAYMVDTYGLPWLGAPPVFKDWNRIDPPDDTELTRHRRIAEIQGNENPFVTDPDRMNQL
ncbi:endonuclease [Marinobacter koreensis]|jgi:deoxyribonuclease-1|uniref:Endonuclease n=1 Tax=Marinobacter koreensis TaxID=335974 RepID=A0ABW0RJY8_9GAMM|nr:endonuclease [Marinobacter koreensis]MCK7546902.1 endonuclease [Marinobacter koreensis]MDX1817776.1 endonuclease [Marinobacter sp.]